MQKIQLIQQTFVPPCPVNLAIIRVAFTYYSYFRTQRIAIVVLTSSSVAVLARTIAPHS
jgi:hypothetical protein